ncbi:FadR/GntR family transcriptional regulator [Nocardia sp. NBC_01388]|uniref:FadR/GntR family transcriptional regulator n=1 Tax=Nocardia sp. NBC_01388 TaxID=2903596 RepID=UPI00325518E2
MVRVPKAAELVASELRRRIACRELLAGQVLPPESELILQFGVSRPTLREALRVLEAERLIVLRRGAKGGACVQAPRREVAATYAGIVLVYQGVAIRDVYQARLTLEVPAVARLARNRTDADLAVLDEALDRYDAEHDPAESIRLHGEFHQLVVRLAGNQTLALLSDMVHHIIDAANGSLRPGIGVSADRARRRTGRAHRKLVEFVRRRDESGAEDLWRRHLQGAEMYLLGNGSEPTVLDLLDRGR